MGTEARFHRLIDEAVAQSFSGWDFSFVADRITELETSWDYRHLVEHQIPHATAMVDMCTGGGEFLNAFDELPALTYAAEGFPPNVDVAKKRLEKRGVRVVAFASDDELPLPSDTFDLALMRQNNCVK
jgi:ubiquinone/menaquinone biosynthesis C-methylase UbiE